jgi:hypothetical protein
MWTVATWMSLLHPFTHIKGHNVVAYPLHTRELATPVVWLGLWLAPSLDRRQEAPTCQHRWLCSAPGLCTDLPNNCLTTDLVIHMIQAAAGKCEFIWLVVQTIKPPTSMSMSYSSWVMSVAQSSSRKSAWDTSNHQAERCFKTGQPAFGQVLFATTIEPVLTELLRTRWVPAPVAPLSHMRWWPYCSLLHPN